MTIIDLDNLNVVGEISLGFVLLSLKKIIIYLVSLGHLKC